MKKSTKILIITAAVLLFAGGAVFAGAMSALGWDFTKLGTVKYETKTYEINEDFNNIEIDVNTDKIAFEPSKDGKCVVVCHAPEESPRSVKVEDGALNIRAESKEKWYSFIGNLDFSTPKITVYLPKDSYGALSVKSDTGDIDLPAVFTFAALDIDSHTADVSCFSSVTGPVKIKLSTGDIDLSSRTAGEIDVTTSTGGITLRGVHCEGKITAKMSTGNLFAENVSCKSLTSDGSTGDVTLKTVTATGDMSIKTSTGDVRFDGADAANIRAKTSTGNIKGVLLSEKIFFAKTSTGKTDVPKSAAGGVCELETSTGDIIISIDR